MKITIIGAGTIGSTTAFALLYAKLPISEIAMVDINAKLAEGNALDVDHAAHVLHKKIKIYGGGEYSKSEKSDYIIITAGVPRPPEMKSRLEVLEPNIKIAKSIATSVKPYLGTATVVVVTNPMDIMTYCFYRLLGLQKERIVGMGSSLDTARMHSKGFPGIAYGEHGDGMIFSEKISKEGAEKVKKTNLEVVSLKGQTAYAPASAIVQVIETMHDGGTLPVSCIFSGEFGFKDCAIGVPARLGSGKLLEIEAVPEGKIPQLSQAVKNLEEMYRFVDKSL